MSLKIIPFWQESLLESLYLKFIEKFIFIRKFLLLFIYYFITDKVLCKVVLYVKFYFTSILHFIQFSITMIDFECYILNIKLVN